MSGKQRKLTSRLGLVAFAVLICGTARADEEAPDAEFLEYLGSWEASDEDWVIFLDETAADAAQGGTRSDSVDQSTGSREQEDDS